MYKPHVALQHNRKSRPRRLSLTLKIVAQLPSVPAHPRSSANASQASRARSLRCSPLAWPVSSTIEDSVAAAVPAGACRRRWGCPASTTLPSESTTTCMEAAMGRQDARVGLAAGDALLLRLQYAPAAAIVFRVLAAVDLFDEVSGWRGWQASAPLGNSPCIIRCAMQGAK